MDKITIKGLKVFAHHGVLDSEKEEGQEFFVDVELFADLCKPAYTDYISNSTNYALVCETVNDFLKNNTYSLIEKAAYELSKEILVKYHHVKAVNITLHKPNAPIDLPFEDVSVDITNKWNQVYLSVGSNMGDRKDYIRSALCKLEENKYIDSVVVSEMIETEPYGYVNQDRFMNAAIGLKTVLNPFELLSVLNGIEADLERVRDIHWGPRTLDLDIIFYEHALINDEKLMIPHVDMQNRKFVLEPLMELCPDFINRRTNLSVRQMYERLNSK